MGPVIRAEEQLVIVTSEPLIWEGINKGQPPRIWNGSIEIERKEYASYDDILSHVSEPGHIRKVLRICMSTGLIDDITLDVLEAAHPLLEAAE